MAAERLLEGERAGGAAVAALADQLVEERRRADVAEAALAAAEAQRAAAVAEAAEARQGRDVAEAVAAAAVAERQTEAVERRALAEALEKARYDCSVAQAFVEEYGRFVEGWEAMAPETVEKKVMECMRRCDCYVSCRVPILSSLSRI